MDAPSQVRVRTRSNIAGSNVSVPANQDLKPVTSIDQFEGTLSLKVDYRSVESLRPSQDAIKDCSKPGGIILDSFGGSGTTLIAAAKTKRRGFLIELEPKYVDVTVRRWEALFGTEARHAETGLTFAEMKRQRESDLTLARQGGEAGHVKG